MVHPAQPDQLLRRLSQELGVNPQELQERARQSKLGYAATMAAVRSNCGCDACRLLRRSVDALVDEAMQEITPPAAVVPAGPVAPARPEPVEG